MRQILLIAGLLFCSIPAHAVTWTHTRNCLPAVGGSNVNTFASGAACSTTSIVAGSLVVVENWWYWTGSDAATSIADSDSVSSTGWTCYSVQQNGVGLQFTQACWTCATASTTTSYAVTMTPTGGTFTYPRMSIDIFTGPQASSGCIGQKNQTTITTNTTAVNTPSITTTVAASLLWSGGGTSLGASWTAGSPWTIGGQNAGVASEYDRGTGGAGVAVNTYSPNYTMGTSSTYNTDILSFSPAGSITQIGGFLPGP